MILGVGISITSGESERARGLGPGERERERDRPLFTSSSFGIMVGDDNRSPKSFFPHHNLDNTLLILAENTIIRPGCSLSELPGLRQAAGAPRGDRNRPRGRGQGVRDAGRAGDPGHGEAGPGR